MYREVEFEVCTGKWNLRCVHGSGIRGVHREVEFEVCTQIISSKGNMSLQYVNIGIANRVRSRSLLRIDNA